MKTDENFLLGLCQMATRVAKEENLRQALEQGLAGPAAACFGRDVQVFEVQAMAALPGRVVEEIDGKAHGLAIGLADQAEHLGLFAEQRALHVFWRGEGFVLGVFVDGQFAHEAQNQAAVVHRGGTNIQMAHGNIREKWLLSPYTGLRQLLNWK